MLKKNKFFTFLTILAFLVFSLVIKVPDGNCITIQEERELSKEFMEVVKAQFPLIDDPTILDYVNQVGKRILAVVPPQPFEYQFHVLREDVFNAFATPAGHIFLNSGLFAALDSEEELAGIIGHEIAHVVCRHISDRIESSKKIGHGHAGRYGGRCAAGCRWRRYGGQRRDRGVDGRRPDGSPGLQS